MIGKVLNSRYKVTELLGEGGMALVYEAKDLLLDRWVALKLLRPQLVSDKDFVRRFHREAKAVASLSHPNIVNIYDIGQDKDIHYLVMENIRGENLNEMIKREGVLPPTVALEIATQICEALVVAHRNNIVHCDIKPHNILITKDSNRVKVTDFGIARAVNSATLAQTETVIGTAHYFSPEQARGETINASSDLYSLGVVLYEMLTGQVPFRGDSPITVALKHINEEPLPPSSLNENLPKRIDKLVLKVLAKDPTKRFADASEMLKALHGMAKTFEKAETPAPGAVKPYSDNDQTQVLPRVGAGEMPEPEPERSLWERMVKPLAITVGVLVLIGIVSIFALNNYTNAPEVKVPSFVGLSKEEAVTKAEYSNIRVIFEQMKVTSELEADHVVSQDIPEGRMVKKNRTISLTLSKGADRTTVPDLVGKGEREFTVALEDANLKLGERDYDFSADVQKGYVISQTPLSNTEVKVGEKINIVISKGPEPVKLMIPTLIGMSREEAERTIAAANLARGTVTEEETTRHKAGWVISQEPAAGTMVQQGTTVNLKVSSGIHNPKNLPVYSFDAFYYIPEGISEQRIQIIVEDDNGREEIYNVVHKPGERVALYGINAVGPATLQIYNNGELVRSQSEGF